MHIEETINFKKDETSMLIVYPRAFASFRLIRTPSDSELSDFRKKHVSTQVRLKENNYIPFLVG